MNLTARKIIVCLAVALLVQGAFSAQILLTIPQAVTAETLTAHLAAQLASRTNGAVTSDFTGPRAQNNFFTAPPTNKPNFWLLGVTNIFAQSAYQIQGGGAGRYSCADYFTAIAPHFCVTAQHVGPGIGRTNVWLLPNGTYYSNIVVAAGNVAGTDIEICLMQSTNWTVCKILPDARSKIPFWRYNNVAAYAPPVFVRFHQGVGQTNEFQSSFVSSSYSPGQLGYAYSALRFGDYKTGLSGDIQHGDAWIGGDSSGAAYAIIKNEAVLLGTAYTGGYCPPLGLYTNEVNSVMASLCAANGLTNETVTLYDLSQFPNL